MILWMVMWSAQPPDFEGSGNVRFPARGHVPLARGGLRVHPQTGIAHRNGYTINIERPLTATGQCDTVVLRSSQHSPQELKTCTSYRIAAHLQFKEQKHGIYSRLYA